MDCVRKLNTHSVRALHYFFSWFDCLLSQDFRVLTSSTLIQKNTCAIPFLHTNGVKGGYRTHLERKIRPPTSAGRARFQLPSPSRDGGTSLIPESLGKGDAFQGTFKCLPPPSGIDGAGVCTRPVLFLPHISGESLMASSTPFCW